MRSARRLAAAETLDRTRSETPARLRVAGPGLAGSVGVGVSARACPLIRQSATAAVCPSLGLSIRAGCRRRLGSCCWAMVPTAGSDGAGVCDVICLMTYAVPVGSGSTTRDAPPGRVVGHREGGWACGPAAPLARATEYPSSYGPSGLGSSTSGCVDSGWHPRCLGRWACELR